ncbi:MAG: tRNA 2-selenouridine(34) synthase MnmH [Lewinella sp.]|nr:tRNA 2-selenouridine(34) synthase MnmH [Lewinella sp.]
MKRVAINDFLKYSSSIPTLDVRSPGEYQTGHLPDSISFPLFSDAERAVIGTLYKQEGRQPAIKKGLEIVGPKMLGFVEQAEALQSDTLALYCWRGGMRSESMAWLLERYGLQTIVLEGGYKAYRNYQKAFYERPLPLCVLTGYTGSKKTELLHLLQAKGAQVVDLEGLARHQGSSFGNRKCKSQPSTEHFQNLIFETIRQFDLQQTIWIEDESMRIGRVNLPEGLYRQMGRSAHVFLEIEKTERIDFLLEDYGQLDKELLISATRSITRKLGTERAARAIACIQAGDLRSAAAIILNYYDSRYHKSINAKKELICAHYRIRMPDLPRLAVELSGQILHEIPCSTD